MRRGNILDIGVIMLLLFIFAVVAVVMLAILVAVNTAFQADSDLPALSKSVMSRATSTSTWVFDFWFMVLFVGLPLVSMALAYFNNIPAVFFWLGVVLNIVTLVVAKALSEVWVNFTSEGLGATAELMPMMNYVLSNYMVYVLFVFLIIAGGTYVKTRPTGGYFG